MFRRHAFVFFLLVVQACGLNAKDDGGQKCLSHGVDIPSICDGINDKFTSPSGGALGAGGSVAPGAGGSVFAGSGGNSSGGSINSGGGSFGAGGAAASPGGTSFGGEGGASW